tara:strand:+ start:432 stop:992 length:561 start_codon:yes stop_codon:yes gene_type:complete
MEKSEKNKALTKKERRLLRRQQREKEHFKYRRRGKIKNVLLIAAVALIVAGVIISIGWFLVTRPPSPESEIISDQGIHWHTELSITILGQEQVIPDDVGHGSPEQPVHTHEEDNFIHLEFVGLVKEDDIRLGRFFKNWNRQFNQDCIFTNCNGVEGTVKMFVNGEPNFEFENYVMRHEDKITIIFE